jgi:hypothetical protein
MAKSLFEISGEKFEIAYAAGHFAGRGVADDVASVLPLIRILRAKREAQSRTHAGPT